MLINGGDAAADCAINGNHLARHDHDFISDLQALKGDLHLGVINRDPDRTGLFS